jgi:hypothetical protein
MQPLPYTLHVLKKIFEDVDLTLTGDIINDLVFQKQLLFGDVDYATFVTLDSLSLLTMSEDKVETGILQVDNSLFSFHRYYSILEIPNPGRYNVYGTLHMYYNLSTPSAPIYLRIRYRDTIWTIGSTSIGETENGIRHGTRNIDFNFDTIVDGLPNVLIFESLQNSTDLKIIFDIKVDAIRLFDNDGSVIPTIINKD